MSCPCSTYAAFAALPVAYTVYGRPAPLTVYACGSSCIMQGLKAAFARVDRNGDGKVSRAELILRVRQDGELAAMLGMPQKEHSHQPCSRWRMEVEPPSVPPGISYGLIAYVARSFYLLNVKLWTRTL